MKRKFTVTVETDDSKFTESQHVVESIREEVRAIWVTEGVKVTISEAYPVE